MMSVGTATPSRVRALRGRIDEQSKETEVPCIEVLRKTQLFAGLSDKQLAVVALPCRQVHHRDDQIIFSEGDEVTEVLVVLQGEVNVEVKLFEDFHLRPNAVTVEKVGRSGVIGCCALIEPCRTNMTARCTEVTDIVAVDADDLRGLLEAYPDMGLIVMENAFRMARDRLVLARQQLVAQFGLKEMYESYRNY